MRAIPILPFLLLIALMTASCGAIQALAGATPRPSVNLARTGARHGNLAVGDSLDGSGQPLRVLFVGASVTEGWFASTKEHTYTELVVKGLSGGRRVRVTVLARPGITAEGVAQWDLNIPADVVVVQIATNDFGRDLPVDEYSAAYAMMLDRLRAASPKADLICMGAWSDPAQKNHLGVEVADYDLAAQTQCEADGGHYVDISAAYLNAANHGPPGRETFIGKSDVFHPNDAGHAELARLVLAADGFTEPANPTR
jgi:acyl-CoA thioesterase-1